MSLFHCVGRKVNNFISILVAKFVQKYTFISINPNNNSDFSNLKLNFTFKRAKYPIYQEMEHPENLNTENNEYPGNQFDEKGGLENESSLLEDDFEDDWDDGKEEYEKATLSLRLALF